MLNSTQIALLRGSKPRPLETQSTAETAKIAEAAKQFESLMVGEMMRLMRESDQGGGLGLDRDEAGRSLSEFADQQLAEVIAAQGGLGLANLVKQGLLQGSQPQRLNGADSPIPST